MLAAPAAPAGLTATPASGTRFRLAWTDGSINETRFGLERRHLDSATWTPFRPLATLVPNVTVFADTGLVAGRAYRYRVNACNPAGCSAWVMSGQVVAPVTPAAPAGIGAALQSRTSIRVWWADNSGNETGFEVIRRSRGADGVWGAWVARGAAPPSSGVFLDSAGIGSYQYRVRACDGPLCSTWITSEMVVMPVAPAAPTGPAAVALSPTSIQVTWTDASSGETGFAVSRRRWTAETGWQPWVDVVHAPANATVFLDAGVAPAPAYEYRVAACAGVVCSIWTSAVRVRLPDS
jgi:titin